MELKSDPISESDLTDYLDKQSDFAFELTVLKILHKHDFICEHSGSYDDPVTGTPREFDLRAQKDMGPFRIRLAVECKNIRDNFPLLISCLPRRPKEAFQEIVHSLPVSAGQSQRGLYIGPTVPYAFRKRAESIRLLGNDSIYRLGELVGKSSAQVGRKKQKAAEFYDSDNDVYRKWAQAISSAQDLTDRACYDGEREGKDCFSIVMPVLVVPNERLWVAEFDANGSKLSNPRLIERCPYYIDKSYFGGDRMHGFSYQISHLEFVTRDGLEKLIGDLFGADTVELMFPVRFR
jgi:hypothetical protein